MRPLEIVMLGTKGVPATFGGVERHVEELGARLVERGHSVTVHCRESYVGTDAPTEYRGMKLVTRGSVATKHLDALSHTAAATASVMAHPPDIVHYHAIGPSIFSAFPRVRRRTASVVSVHGLDWQRDKWSGSASRMLQLGEWTSGRFPDATICVSQSLRDHYQARFRGRRIEYIPNGVPIPTRRRPQLIADEFGLAAGSYVLFLGRFVPEKAPDLLIEAFRKLDTDAKLVLAGGAQFDDDYERRLTELAADDPRILYPGYVSGDLRDELYTNAALFVLPSRLEGLPISLLEALSYGTPVLASDIDCHVEIVGRDEDYGHLFRTDDSADLQRALAAALAETGDPATLERTVAGRELVEREFAWDDVVDSIIDLYADVIPQ